MNEPDLRNLSNAWAFLLWGKWESMDAIRWILLVPAIVAAHIVGSFSGATVLGILSGLLKLNDHYSFASGPLSYALEFCNFFGAAACTIATVLVAPARVKAAIYIPLLIVVSWNLFSFGAILHYGGISTFAVRLLADILGWAAVVSFVWIAQVRSDSANKPQAILGSLT